MTRTPPGPRFSWDFEPTARSRGPARRGIALREAALARAPLFAGLSKRHLRAIARVAGVSEYPAGATVVKEGAAGSVFFVILEGSARVVRGRRTVTTLRPGDFFGEMSLLDGGPRTASVTTEAPSRFLTLSGRDLKDILSREPTLATKILGIMAGRIRSLERPPVG
ncbi:MAG: cyclic nucleotide-binding domain-containing protein [Actinomycetota bacterium]